MAILAGSATISAGDTENILLDYTDWLDGSELLTGTPTVSEVTTSDLTFANEAVSTGTLTILNRSVAAGAAVTFTVSGMVAGTTYRVRITVSTDASPARTKVVDIKLVTAAAIS